MTTPTMQGLTPDLYGYRKCSRCGTWRLDADLTAGLGEEHCESLAWCSAEVTRKGAVPGLFVAHAGSPTTGLDANGDAL